MPPAYRAPVVEVIHAASVPLTTTVSSTLATALFGSLPNADVESPLSWIVMAATRRLGAGTEAGGTSQQAAQMAAAQTSTSLTTTAVAAAAPVNQPPIVEQEAALGTPDPRTGTVAGQVIAEDPEKKKLTYTVVTQPTEGKLVLNKSTGAFTYTPTTTQRVLAGLSSEYASAQFTVAVSDGVKANVQTVTINVAINPMPLADAGAIETGGSVDAIAVTKTRAYVADSVGKTITVIDTVNRAVVTTIHLDVQPVSLDVTPDGKRVFVVDDETHLIHVIDGTTNTALSPIDFGDNRYPISVAVSPDGKTLMATGGLFDARTGTWTSVVTKVAVATGKITGTVKLPGASPDAFYSIVFSPDGKKVYVVGDLLTDDPQEIPLSAVYTFATTSTAAKLVATGTYILDVVVNPAGTRVYVNDVDEGVITVLDAKNHKVLGTINVTPETLSGITLSKDGSLLFAVDSVDGAVRVYDTTANHVLLTTVDLDTTTEGYYPGAVLSPDGRELYYSTDQGIQVISVLPATAASTPGAPVGNVIIGAFGTRYQVTVDVDPQTLEPSGSTRVSILDTDGRVITTSASIAGSPNGFAFPMTRPDGSLLLTTYDEVTNTTTVTAISTSGVATTVGTVTGVAASSILVASNGAAFVLADVDGTQSAYRLIRVSRSNAFQTYEINGTTSGLPPTLAPNGTAYVVYQDSLEQIGVLAVDSSGLSTTVLIERPGIAGPVTISSDGKAYVAVSVVNDDQTAVVTKMLTFTGSSYTEREIPGVRLGLAVAGAKGTIYQTTVDYDNGKTYVTELTATTLKTSTPITGLALGQPVVAGDGTTYMVILNGGGYQLGIAKAGKTRVVPINGVVAGAVDTVGGAALTVGWNKNAYVAYVDANGRYHVAIVTPAGRATIKDMPVGTVIKNRVYFTLKGAAAQIVERQDTTGAYYTSAVILSSGKSTEEVPGQLIAGSIDLKGNGYLITGNMGAQGPEARVVGFNSAGKTIAKIIGPGGIVLAVDPDQGPFGFAPRPIVLAPNGTAYVTLSSGLEDLPGTAEVWAITAKGATRIQTFDTAAVTAVTVAKDGTVYVTVSQIDEGTGQFVSTVRALSTTV
ncbi:hypothetical protein CQY20_26815 [Mycolicibacterium agri]|uniref:Cadherin domain-containing protein n=1 Tax=Mycolicibacterium agri TaxID=36811 RepID=A0A2A7MRP9_MYCAG|nr:hypothetical protein CQY20_26815 [Mycolicibacterium agri]